MLGKPNPGDLTLAPAWPGIKGSVADMRRDPASFNDVGTGEVVTHFTQIVRRLPEPPIIMGHCFGGVVTQLLIDQHNRQSVVLIPLLM